MNLVFSFDSILSAIALTKKVWIISGAIIVSGVAMIALADKVSEFYKKIECLKFLVESVRFAYRRHEVHAMNKATFYL